ncbi:MAG: zinc metallopeptidase [Clostridia bacterium]|nr:zinc metallopeptidase [Clostridia bacterium]
MIFGLFRFDWTILLVIPGLIISIWAQIKVSTTFKKYSQMRTRRGMTGYDAARRILDSNGLSHVRIEQIGGHLSDHYDPRANVIRLSHDVYSSSSPAAIGVAAHEAGHAIQYAKEYGPIKLRAGLVSITQFSSALAIPLFFIGLMFASDALMLAGILLYAAIAFFQLVTLPVEFNASSRALKVLSSSAMLNQEELDASRKVLSAAAMTYVAALLTSLLTLLRLLLLANSRNNRR